ncbi:MAG: coproporphyrinogen dehydrogenase HemZ [Oscillospiraceae bacterium]|jgi:oxygen-independent coproporphyrinogen-3 oxidase
MKLYLKNHNYRYAAEQILLMMFPDQRPEYPTEPPEGDFVLIRLSRGKQLVTATCKLCLNGNAYHGRTAVPVASLTDQLVEDRLLQRAVKLCFYRAARRSTTKKPVWGALTGIRPGKILSNYLEEGLSEAAAISTMCQVYDVSRTRALLCRDTAIAGLQVKKSLSPKDICLYIGIPFCPTRCAYCSFVSQSVEKSMALIPDFLSALSRDLAATAEVVRELGLHVVSIYIGGGTPTTLSPAQLDTLCAQLETQFDLSALRDYTVEAGRPDTITPEKLAVLHRYDVRRISVNPQTMEDPVLETIGRKHTAADVLRALDMVRDLPGCSVNMDLIAGLPSDSPAGFDRTLDTVLALRPENITVHTLSLKKGSRILLEGTEIPDAEQVGTMLDSAASRLRAAGYVPYYLYRQKFMSGGFENVGWTLPGQENLYNICIMEELSTILAVGGGASTKLVTGTGRIERIFTPKYPREYIDGIEKVLSQKSIIKEFYHGLQSEQHQ